MLLVFLLLYSLCPPFALPFLVHMIIGVGTGRKNRKEYKLRHSVQYKSGWNIHVEGEFFLFALVN